MPDHVRVRRQEQGPCRARLAFIVTFLMAVLHPCSPCFSLSKNMSKSCQAAALGPAPNQEDLKKLDRALPTYMLKTTGWDEQMAMKRWTETLKWRCEIDDDKVVQRPNPDFFEYIRTTQHICTWKTEEVASLTGKSWEKWILMLWRARGSQLLS